MVDSRFSRLMPTASTARASFPVYGSTDRLYFVATLRRYWRNCTKVWRPRSIGHSSNNSLNAGLSKESLALRRVATPAEQPIPDGLGGMGLVNAEQNLLPFLFAHALGGFVPPALLTALIP